MKKVCQTSNQLSPLAVHIPWRMDTIRNMICSSNPSMQLVLILCLALGLPLATSSSSPSLQLCADPSTGAFVGLAADVDTYESIPGSASDAFGGSQKWSLVTEGSSGDDGESPVNSFTGQFLQVLPDVGRNYPERGSQLAHVEQLLTDSPYISFTINVRKAGWHKLFLRWTGGDTKGAGDSLYVSMHKEKGRKPKDVIIGQRTLKPKVIPIDAGAFSFAGCCYNMQTHACPCMKQPPKDNTTCDAFVQKHEAGQMGIKCRLGAGIMEFVDQPQWYLFAGQEEGNVIDFNSEPWDATCEANGSSSADSGSDFASWNLDVGTYIFNIFAREDGTAVDGFYLAGPDSDAPGMKLSFAAGDSTVCGGSMPGGVPVTALLVVGMLGAVGTVLVFAHKTETGSRIVARARSLLVGGGQRSLATAHDGILQYEEMGLHPDDDLGTT